jgi:hypothetical protein
MQYVYRDAYLTVDMSTAEHYKVFLRLPNATAFVEIDPAPILAPVTGEGSEVLVKIPAALLTIFGEYTLKVVTYTDVDMTTVVGVFSRYFDVAESPVRQIVSADTCLLVGSVKDVAGRPPSWQGVEVFFRPYTHPQVHQSSVISSEPVRTLTNLEGYFEMPVIRGTKIVFEIPRCGVRFQYDVPYDLDVINMVDVFNAIIS